ncbi:MAG: aminotransferase class III-fold pyridoxal phosphate-dependent enzyme [Salinigranum sp.]
MDRDTAEPRVGSIPGERARRWVEYHHEFAAPSTYVYDFVWDYSAEAAGPFCTDVDGNVLLDFTSQVASAPLGYDNPKVLDRLREFDLVDPLKMAGQDFYVSDGNPPGEGELPTPAGLMERLVEITAHYDMDTVFLSNSGAEAVENAIKIAYDHAGGAPHAVTFDGAFHGRTLGALSLNRSKAVHRRRFPEVPGVFDAPFCEDRTCTPDTCECGFFAGGTSRLREKLDPARGSVDPEEVAYVIVEPIQGEGGYRVPSEAFMRELADVVVEFDLTLVVDEVQSGLGRTGEMWASDHYPIEPDVIAAAKALRVGATVSRADVFPEERTRLSSTWGGGDILGAIQGALTIDAIEEYDLLSNATARGRQFVEAVRDARPANAVDVRGVGLMLAVEFDTRERRDDVQAAAFERGLLTLGCGYKTLRLLPPLDVREREIEMGVDLLLAAIEAAA